MRFDEVRGLLSDLNRYKVEFSKINKTVKFKENMGSSDNLLYKCDLNILKRRLKVIALLVKFKSNNNTMNPTQHINNDNNLTIEKKENKFNISKSMLNELVIIQQRIKTRVVLYFKQVRDVKQNTGVSFFNWIRKDRKLDEFADKINKQHLLNIRLIKKIGFSMLHSNNYNKESDFHNTIKLFNSIKFIKNCRFTKFEV